MTFIQFKICCCVQHFIQIGWFFIKWRYIDFQNGGCPPSLNCFTTIYKTICTVSVAGPACQNSCQSDTQIWRYSCLNFSPIWLMQAPKIGFFGGLWTPKCDNSSSRPQKSYLRKSASFKLSTVKIRRGVWPVGELTESVTHTHTHTHR